MLSHMMLPDCVGTRRLYYSIRNVKEVLVSKKVFLEKDDEESLFLFLAGLIVSKMHLRMVIQPEAACRCLAKGWHTN